MSLIGEACDLTYEHEHRGDTVGALVDMVDGDLSGLREKRSVVVVGQGGLARSDGAAILGHAMRLCEASDSKLLILHTAAGRVGAMDVGAVTEGGMAAALDGADVVYSLGADEIEIPAGPFVIYQGSHGDRGAHRADVILPGAAYTEEPALFVNTEGRPQLALRSGFAPGEAKDNWAILRALSGELGAALPFDTLAQLRQAVVRGASAPSGDRPGARERVARDRARRGVRRAAALRRAGLLADQPDRAGVGGHGEALLQRPCAAPAAAAGGGVRLATARPGLYGGHGRGDRAWVT